MVKICFVSGQYKADSEIKIQYNILQAEMAGIELARRGWGIFIPHKNTAGFHKYNIPRDHWLEMDLVILERCDAVFMLHGWEDSEGACKEHAKAKKLGKPIYYQEDGYPHPSE